MPDEDPHPAVGQVPPRKLKGHVDVAEPTRVSGWAYDAAAPDESLVIELVEGGEVLARTQANLLRADLRDAGLGQGLYGFQFTLPDRFFLFARHVVRVRVAGTDLDLPGSPAVIERPDLPGCDAPLLQQLVRRRLDAAGSPEDLGGLVSILAGELDHALGLRHRLGRPVFVPATPGALPAPPGSIREAVERLRETYGEIEIAPSRKPEVSIVLVSRDRFAAAHAAIAAIAATPPEAPFEVILVDDASTDETIVARAVLPAAVKIFRTPQPVGEVKAQRAGQALALGRYVLFLDPRARLRRGAVDAMVRAFMEDPAIGAAGALIEAPDGKVAAAGLAILPTGRLVPVGAGLDPADPRVALRREVDAVLSHALMIEKALWARVGGTDEASADRPHADADLALRIRKAGRKVVSLDEARAVLAIDPATLVPESDIEAAGRAAEGRRRLRSAWAATLDEARYQAPDPLDHPHARRALVIDHAYPTPHLDAGSAAMVSHIKALQDLGYRVLFVPGGPPEPHATGTPLLQKMGVECHHKPAVAGVEAVLEREGAGLDVVYIHRLPNAQGYLEACRRLAPRAHVVFSVADLHFLRAEREAALRGDGEGGAAVAAVRDEELALIAKVDAVITHSSYEADLIREAVPAARVHVVPWSIAATPVTRPFEERSGIAFIGSYQHAPNLDAARWLVEEIMPLVRRESPGIELQLVGAGLPPDLVRPGSGVVARGWVANLHEEVLSRVRLTVAPLRFGAGLKGKVLESLASGVACVMSEVAAEGLPRMATIQHWTVNGAEGFARAIIEQHEGLGATREALDEARQVIAAFTDARSVASALSAALAPPSHQNQVQPAAQGHVQRD